MLYQDLGLRICVPNNNIYLRLSTYIFGMRLYFSLLYTLDIGDTLMSVVQRNQVDVLKLLPDSVMACLHG